MGLSRRIESRPFAGGSTSAYQVARREIREQAAAILGVPLRRVRIAPAAMTLEQLHGERWIALARDVVDEHELRLRHGASADRFRLVLRL